MSARRILDDLQDAELAISQHQPPPCGTITKQRAHAFGTLVLSFGWRATCRIQRWLPESWQA